MKRCSKCGEDKPRTDFHSHKGRPDGLSAICKPCNKAHASAWYAANIEKGRSRRKAWRDANPERHRAAVVEWHIVNADRTRAQRAAWKVANPARVNNINARRRAAKLRATPAWADHEKIAEKYRFATMLDMQVDHIVPLMSPVVCGLHVETNLQLLTPAENARKGNRSWPDMP